MTDVSTMSWHTRRPGVSTSGSGPRLIISRVIVPEKFAWIVGAVKWTRRPVLANELRPSIRAARRPSSGSATRSTVLPRTKLRG